MSTVDNLKAGFAGESQAHLKYLAFAKKADAEGKPQIAKLFRSVAEAETIHAHTHLRVLNGVGSTADNVLNAIEGEKYEFTQMYPEFVATAKQENNTGALKSFEFAMAVEKIHHSLYSQAAEALKSGKDLAAAKIYVCPLCGNTVLNTVPDNCAICTIAGSKFLEVN